MNQILPQRSARSKKCEAGLRRRSFVKKLGAALVAIAIPFPILAQNNGRKIVGDGKNNLTDRWRFRLDPANAGVQELWFEKDLDKIIKSPCSLPEHGIGDKISMKTPWMGNKIGRAHV